MQSLLSGWIAIDTCPVATIGDVCLEHLEMMGAATLRSGGTNAWGAHDFEPCMTLRRSLGRGGPEADVSCAIRLPRAGAPAAEALAQALTGLMTVHGRDAGRPRRLGLDVVSTAAGILTAHAILATLLGRRRGLEVGRAETNLVGAGLLFVAHHLAMATSGDVWVPEAAGPDPAPPFRARDGVWFEIEAPHRGAWADFWGDLGVRPQLAVGAWDAFELRYNTGWCTVPTALSEAASRSSIDDVEAAAGRHRVAICRIRRYAEVLGDPECWDGAAATPRTHAWEVSPRRQGSDAGRAPAACRASIARPGRRPGDGLLLPLAGLRVVEITHGLPGPLTGRLLQQLGADVTRVERPGGDPARELRPAAAGVGAGFLAYNSGKHSVEIDYKDADGREALADLAAGSDVFLHNWLPGRARTLALEWTDLSPRNPRLVYATISGWGPEDPLDRLGTEYFVQAHTGMADGLNASGCPPATSRAILAGVTSSLLATEGILAALYARELGHGGSRVDTSLVAGAMALQAPVLRAMACGAETTRRHGRPLWSLLDQPLETADGFLVIAAPDGAAQQSVHRLLGCGPGRTAADGRLAESVRSRPTDEWLRALAGREVGAVAVPLDLGALPFRPETEGGVERLPEGCWAPSPPWRFSA